MRKPKPDDLVVWLSGMRTAALRWSTGYRCNLVAAGPLGIVPVIIPTGVKVTSGNDIPACPSSCSKTAS